MIYEYAIDPEIAADSKNLQILENYFGFQYSRYISTFPKKWTKDIICQAKEKGSINGAKVVELLTFLKNRKALKDSGRTYISTISWEENAISAIPEFYCIVHENHVKISEISSGHEKFNIPINWRFKKSTENLKKQFSFVFEKGKVIYIIDPYFDPASPPFKESFNKFFEILASRSDLSEVKIKFCISSKGDRRPFRMGEEEKAKTKTLQNIDTHGFNNIQFFIKSEDMHARYLFCDEICMRADHSFSVDATSSVNVNLETWDTVNELKKIYFDE